MESLFQIGPTLNRIGRKRREPGEGRPRQR
uniref:Uncharacterized protein n=1 Tax=Arundo donax TaxID=35708 RepID=A0A0A9EJ95_ARUDO